MKARILPLFVLVAILSNACSSQDLPTLSGEVRQDYAYTDIDAFDLQRACIAGRWTELCDIAAEGSVLRARSARYIEENGYDGAVCDGSGGNEPSEDARVHAGDQVRVLDAAGVVVGLTLTQPGISEARPGSDPLVIAVTCPLTFEVQLTDESPFYSITVGNTSGPSYSADDLEDQGWHIVLK